MFLFVMMNSFPQTLKLKSVLAEYRHVMYGNADLMSSYDVYSPTTEYVLSLRKLIYDTL